MNKKEEGFATIFVIFLSIILIFLTTSLIILLSILYTKNQAQNSAENLALNAVFNNSCEILDNKILNNAEVISCEIFPDYIEVKSFKKFNQSQLNILSKLGIYTEGIIAKARAN